MNVLFILLIIVILLIVAFLVVYPLLFFKPVPRTLPGNLDPVPLYYSCKSGNRCMDGICDSSTLTCKKSEGTSCSNGQECQTEYYCSGICVSGPNGQVGQPCPCLGVGLTCVGTPSGLSACLKLAGTTCTSNIECVSGVCVQSRFIVPGFTIIIGPTACASGIPSGNFCTKSSDCVIGDTCDQYHFCQPNGVTSGNPGAICVSGSPPPGTSGASNVGCLPGVACQGGICVTSSQGVGNACGGATNCAPPLICTDNRTSLTCGPTSTACTCLTQLPNNCSNSVCFTGNICQVSSNLCRGSPTQACVVNQDCINSCSNKGVVLQLNASNPIGATNLGWVLHSTVPNGLQFVKLFGDIPLLAVANSITSGVTGGLYTFNTSWQLTVPNTDTRTLITGDSNPFFTLLNFAVPGVSGGTVTVFYQYSGGSLSPFNVTSNNDFPAGTQFDTNGNAITNIRRLNINNSGDVITATTAGQLYVKAVTATRYTPILIGTTAILPRYYEGASGVQINNFAYVANRTNQGMVVQFNGAGTGAIYPVTPLGGASRQYLTTDFSLYSTSTTGLPGARAILISRDSLTGSFLVYIIISGSQFIVPGFVDSNSKIDVTSQGFYLYSPNSCT